MKKLCCALALFTGAWLAAAPTATLEQVLPYLDANAEYINFAEKSEDWNHIQRMLNKPAVKPAEIISQKLLKVLVASWHLEYFKAQGISSRKINDRLFITKICDYFGADYGKPSIYSYADNAARDVELLQLPAETCFAFDGVARFGDFLRDSLHTVASSKDPELKLITTYINQYLQTLRAQGFDLDRTLGAFNGRLTIIITYGKNGFNYYISCPDRNGAFAENLKRILPPENGSDTAAAGTFGLVKYCPNKVVFASNAEMLKPAVKTLAQNPLAAEYIRMLPVKGNAWAYLNVSSKMLKDWKRFACADKTLKKYYRANRDEFRQLMLAAVCTAGKEHNQTTVAGNVGVQQLWNMAVRMFSNSLGVAFADNSKNAAAEELDDDEPAPAAETKTAPAAEAKSAPAQK